MQYYSKHNHPDTALSLHEMTDSHLYVADSPGRGVLIGILSALGSALLAICLLALFFFFKYTAHGRILLDRLGRPGEYDDEQAFLQEEERALEAMDDIQRSEYLRAKGKHILDVVLVGHLY